MRTVVAGVLVVALTALDQGLKALVEGGMALGEMIPLLPFLALLRAHNEGVAFSFLAGFGPWPIIALTGLITAGAVVMLVRAGSENPVTRLGLALIIAGALGNLIDRAQHGYVVDYILFHTPAWSFAIFNLADMFITLGAGIMLLDEFFLKARRQAG